MEPTFVDEADIVRALLGTLSLSLAQVAACGVHDDPEAEKLAVCIQVRSVRGRKRRFTVIYYPPTLQKGGPVSSSATSLIEASDADECAAAIAALIAETYVQAREGLCPLPTIA